jgi:hypothetical protein
MSGPWVVTENPLSSEISHAEEAQADVDRMADAGVFADADAFFDAIEAGVNVLNDHYQPAEWVEQFMLRRPG